MILKEIWIHNNSNNCLAHSVVLKLNLLFVEAKLVATHLCCIFFLNSISYHANSFFDSHDSFFFIQYKYANWYSAVFVKKLKMWPKYYIYIMKEHLGCYNKHTAWSVIIVALRLISFRMNCIEKNGNTLNMHKQLVNGISFIKQPYFVFKEWIFGTVISFNAEKYWKKCITSRYSKRNRTFQLFKKKKASFHNGSEGRRRLIVKIITIPLHTIFLNIHKKEEWFETYSMRGKSFSVC